MLSRVVSVPATLILLVSCGRAPSHTSGDTAAAHASASASRSANDESAVDVAHIVCEKDAVIVRDQVVRAERDGVHLLVANPGGAWGIDLHHESWAYGTGEGFKL